MQHLSKALTPLCNFTSVCRVLPNKADPIVVDLRKAQLVPLLRVASSFVHQGQARDVEAVMADGQWLIRDGIVLTMDEEQIVQEADRIGRAAWQRLFEERPDRKE